MRSKIICAAIVVFAFSMYASSLCLAQLPTVSNSKLSVDCVRTQDASYYGFVIQQDKRSVQLVVEREWLKKTYPEQFPGFRNAEDEQLKSLIQQYENRIDAWIIERTAMEGLVNALKEERDRIRESNSPNNIADKKFILLRFEPKEVKHVFLQPTERKQVAALAWHQGLDDVTLKPERQLKAELAELKGSLEEARLGLAQQLPACELTDQQWENRQAMFEYSVLRQMEFQGHGTALFDPTTMTGEMDLGQILNSLLTGGENGLRLDLGVNLGDDLGVDLGSLGKELGLREFQNVQPAVPKDWKTNLTAKADKQGFRSVMIKRSLPVSKPDWVEVEMIFMAKTGNRWHTIKTVKNAAQISVQKQDDIERIAADPQVKSVLQAMKGLGLDSNAHLLNQALVQGAAVEQATESANQQMGEFLQLNTLHLDLPYVEN